MPTDTTITRYGLQWAQGRLGIKRLSMLVDPQGGWVRYEDHERTLTAAHAARDEALGICRGLQDVALGRVTPFAVVRAEAMEVSQLRAQLTTALRERDEARAALEAARDECDRAGKCPFVEGA